MNVQRAFEGSAAAAAGGLSVVLVLMCLIVLPLIAYGVVSYILYAKSLHTIAKRRGIHKSWLAWLPVGNAWILGCISDQYRYVAKGQVRNRRKLLLWLSIITTAVAEPFSVISENLPEAQGVVAGAVSAMLVLLGVVVALGCFGVSIVKTVYECMALYDLFVSCDPDKRVVNLVLSILTPASPFIVFGCRNKDLGMPPRQPTQPQEPVAEVTAIPVEEPEETPEA